MKNNTCMRVHNYPAVPLGTVIKPNQLRCGEHTDFTSVTLLFADRPGGLQVSKLKIYVFVCIHPLPAVT